MTILALFLSAIILILAAIHMLWGIGFWFPTRDEAKLVAATVGARDVDRMPGPIPCGIVAALLVLIVIILWGPVSGLRSTLIGMAAVVFVLRGCLAYTQLWRKMTPQEPFATYDRRYYGPLCFGLGTGLLILLLGGS